MNTFTKLIVCAALMPVAAIAQDKHQIEAIKKQTNLAALEKMAAENAKTSSDNLDRALRLAMKYNWPLNKKLDNGGFLTLIGVDDYDLPLYLGSDNLGAAITSRTNLIWPSATNITPNLSGRGYTVRVWDGGPARVTHREFQGRAINVSSGSNVSDHATHVTGTIIAAGISPNAKGGAYEAFSRNFTASVDATTVPSEAAQGATITNHSYGIRAGWDFDNNTWLWYGHPDSTTDYKNGYYDSRAQQWDNFHVNAPYLLMVKSAGNSRDLGPPPGTPHTVVATGATSTLTRQRNGPYDCLSSTSNSKNVLVVAAVRNVANYTGPSSVIMSSFSSWGPTDDGRIKPDISAKGVDVFSCTSVSDQSYASYDGTSMAAPATSGPLMLLQEHYSNTHNKRLMWGSTLKALILHTADEAGTTPGPDYRFGWGLLNASRAAALITQDSALAIIREGTLNNGNTIEFDVQARGNMPLTATLVWSDPGGTPGPPISNRRTPMLVNDLDLRVINNSNQNVFFPWKLDPLNPQAAATREDNNLDNVEKIEVANPGTGTYKIRISHKGNLVGSGQRYSLIVDGIIVGDTSVKCKGRQYYNASFGTFDDGSGRNRNYMNNANCLWEIGDGDTTNAVAIVFNRMNLLAGDTLYVYNGNSTTNPLLGKYSGNNIPPRVVASSGRALLHFVSNATGNALGWEVTYNILKRPTATIVITDTSICRGASVAFQATTTATNEDGWVYTWNFPGATPETFTGKNGSVVYNNLGTYSVTLTVTNEAGSVVIQRPNLIKVNPKVGNLASAYYESFESANAPFYTSHPDSAYSAPGVNDVFAWRKVTFAGRTGNSSMRIRNNPPSVRVRNLFTPTFNMTGISNPRLVWWRAYARGAATSNDGLRILVSRNCGQSWFVLRSYNNTQLSTIGTGASDIIPGNNFIPSPSEWVKDSVSLNAYANDSSVIFRFEMTSDRGNNLYIDDIRVGDMVITAGSKLQPSTLTELLIMPNPVNNLEGSIVLRTDIPVTAQIEISDLAGRKINLNQNQFKLMAGDNPLPLKGIFNTLPPKGVYIVKANIENYTITQKIVIQ